MIAELLFAVTWKSALVAVAVIALLVAMRGRAAKSRVAVGGLAFGLLFVLPAVLLAQMLLPAPIMAVPAEVTAPAAPFLADALDSTLSAFPKSPSPVAPAPVAFYPEALLPLLWVTGALAIMLRLVAGLVTLARWTRDATPVARHCAGMRILASDSVDAPLSWGWRDPVVLVDRRTLANPAELDAVLAHEAAHLARGDWLRLVAARTVVALFWFNPFVWLLERHYLQDIEEAADEEAMRHVAPACYAQVLLNVARGKVAPAGANSVAAGALGKRIAKALAARRFSRWEGAWRAGALAGVASVALPIVAIQVVAPAAAAKAGPAPAPVIAPIAPRVVAGPAAAPRTVHPTVRAPMQVSVVRPVVAVPALAIASAAQAGAQAASQAFEADAENARQAAERMRAHGAAMTRDAQIVARHAGAEAAKAMARARIDMSRGADDMERGAESMKKGAAEMRDEARKLRDPAYRAKVIADARTGQIRWNTRYGHDHVPTDQELIDAIPKLEEGAKRMDEGVERMREGARKMRAQSSER